MNEINKLKFNRAKFNEMEKTHFYYGSEKQCNKSIYFILFYFILKK